MIGQGSYGKVFLVKHKANSRHFAMKVIKKDLVFRTCQDEGIKGKCFRDSALANMSGLVAERDILTMFDHPFIMKLEYAF